MSNGISPLIGEDGRAFQASISHLPPDQQQQHIISAAQTGLVPFSLAAALQAALKLNPPVQAPPPGTVVSDMVQQLAGGQPAAPQMPMPQGAPTQPSAGLASLPVSNIGTQAMAGGGIVAFQDGGGVFDYARFAEENELPTVPYRRDYEPPRAEEDPRGLQDLIRQMSTGYETAYEMSPEYRQALKEAAPGAKPDESAEKAKALKEFDTAGMGGALTKRIEALAAREAKDKERFAKEGRWNVAKGFFEAAAEAGQPGATLLGSLSRGAANYAGAKAQMSDKVEAAQAALEDQRFAVESAKEELNFKRTESAKAAYDKALARYDAQRTQYLTLLGQQENMKSRYAASVAKAQAKAAAGVDKLGAVIGPDLEEARAAVKYAEATRDPEKIAAATANFNDVLDRSNKIAAVWQGLGPKQDQQISVEVVKAIKDTLKDKSSALSIIDSSITRISQKGVKTPQDIADLKRLKQDYNLEKAKIEREVRGSFGQEGIGSYSAPAVGGEGWAIVPPGAQ